MAQRTDLGSVGLITCGFDSRLRYHIYIRELYSAYYEKGGVKVNYTTGFIRIKEWITNSPKIGDNPV